MKEVNIKEIVELSKKVLFKHGLTTSDADIVINHLLQEELLGKESHGFFRLPSIVRQLQSNNNFADIEIDSVQANCTRINGNNNLGLVVAQKACEISIKNAEKKTLTLTVATDYAGTTGAMGYFARQIADKGYISIIFCNSEYAVAPWGGKDPILGTNPIAFGIPMDNQPIVVDFATSAKTYGELMLAASAGKKIKEGIVLDKDGNASTDPNDANNGCQLPMAEHKGYGLALIIEILAGAFIGAKAGKDAVLGSDGFVIITLQPDIFVPRSLFFNHLNSLITEIRNSSIAPGFDSIRIPGENAMNKINTNFEKGKISIDNNTYETILSFLTVD